MAPPAGASARPSIAPAITPRRLKERLGCSRRLRCTLSGTDIGDLLANHPMARAALEMAELDMRLKQRRIPLASYLGVTRSEVPAGAVDPARIDRRCARSGIHQVLQGFGRVKLKLVPAERAGFRPFELVDALEQSFPGVEVEADANGSFDLTSFDQAVLEPGSVPD